MRRGGVACVPVKATVAVTVRLDVDLKARIDAARAAGHVVNVSAILKAALERELARIEASR